MGCSLVFDFLHELRAGMMAEAANKPPAFFKRFLRDIRIMITPISNFHGLIDKFEDLIEEGWGICKTWL